MTTADPSTPLHPHARGLTPALLVGVLLASLEMAIVNAVLPRIATDLRDAGLLPWVFTGYIAASTISTPIFGVLADRIGRRATYALGMGLLLVGSVLAAVAPSMSVLLLGRVLQGAGGGALMPITIVIFGDLYGVSQRAKMFGYISLVWGASTLVGPLVGAQLTAWFGWRAVFWANLPPGAVALWGVWRGLGVPVVRVERGAAQWRDLFATPTQRWLNVSGSLAVAALYGVIAHLAVYVQGVQGGTSMDAGLALLPLTLAWTASSHVVGRLVPKLGLASLIRWGHAALALGLCISWYWTMAPIGLGLVGAAMGAIVSCVNIAIQESAPAPLKGSATSSAIFLRNLAATIVVPIYGWLAGFRPGMADLHDVPGLADGIRAVMGACAVIALVALAVVLFRVPRRLSVGPG